MHSDVGHWLNSTQVYQNNLTYIYLHYNVSDHNIDKPCQWQNLSCKAEIELEEVSIGLPPEDSIKSVSNKGIVIEFLFNRQILFQFTID